MECELLVAFLVTTHGGHENPVNQSIILSSVDLKL